MTADLFFGGVYKYSLIFFLIPLSRDQGRAVNEADHNHQL